MSRKELLASVALDAEKATLILALQVEVRKLRIQLEATRNIVHSVLWNEAIPSEVLFPEYTKGEDWIDANEFMFVGMDEDETKRTDLIREREEAFAKHRTTHE